LCGIFLSRRLIRPDYRHLRQASQGQQQIHQGAEWEKTNFHGLGFGLDLRRVLFVSGSRLSHWGRTKAAEAGIRKTTSRKLAIPKLFLT